MNTFSRVPKSMVDPVSVPTEISLGKHVQCLGKWLPGPQTPGPLYSNRQAAPACTTWRKTNVKVAEHLMHPARRLGRAIAQ